MYSGGKRREAGGSNTLPLAHLIKVPVPTQYSSATLARADRARNQPGHTSSESSSTTALQTWSQSTSCDWSRLGSRGSRSSSRHRDSKSLASSRKSSVKTSTTTSTMPTSSPMSRSWTSQPTSTSLGTPFRWLIFRPDIAQTKVTSSFFGGSARTTSPESSRSTSTTPAIRYLRLTMATSSGGRLFIK